MRTDIQINGAAVETVPRIPERQGTERLRRTLHTIPQAAFASSVPCGVRLHALWRADANDFESDMSLVNTAGPSCIRMEFRGPLLLDVVESDRGIHLTLHRSPSIDTAAIVKANCAKIPDHSGSALLTAFEEVRALVSGSLGRALERQIQLDLEKVLASAAASEPLLILSMPAHPRTAQILENCLRGEFESLWGADLYAGVQESGPIPSLMCRDRTIDVQIAYLDRKQWKQARSFFQSAAAAVTATGEILVGSQLFDSQESCEHSMIIASQELRLRNASTVPVRAPICCSLQQLEYFVPREVMVQAEAFAAGQYGTKKSEIDCDFCLSIPRHALATWFSAPPDRSRQFSTVYTHLSSSVQQSMRQWLPAFWTEPMKNLPTRMAGLMARLYGSSKPIIGTSRADLVPDWMSDDAAKKVWASGSRVLANSIAQEKVATMKTPHQAQVYARRQIELLHEWVWKDRLLPGILRQEGMLIESFIKMGAACRELYDSGEISDAVIVRKALIRAMKAPRRIMRHLFMRVDYSVLVPMLFIEATNALNQALDRDYPITITVTLRAPSGAEKKIFNQTANFSRSRH